jgi:hypothetical protein
MNVLTILSFEEEDMLWAFLYFPQYLDLRVIEYVFAIFLESPKNNLLIKFANDEEGLEGAANMLKVLKL